MNETQTNLSNKYQQKNEKQHILDNPDTYIGSIEHVDSNVWIINEENSINIKTSQPQVEDQLLNLEKLLKDQVLPPSFFFKMPLNWQTNWHKTFETNH